jgi:hypothetical protein
MPTPRTAAVLVLTAICALGLLARLGTAKVPVLDHHSWRQADTASIARNFVRERFNPLYPQVEWRGAQAHGYVETGLELHALIVAAISLLTGFHTDIGRFLSCAYFAGSLLLLHGFLRERYGVSTALVGSAIYSFGLALPFFMDRTFMNEPMLLLLTFASYRSAQRYVTASGVASWMGLLASTTLIAVIKPVYLVCWAGILGLLIERDGRRMIRRWGVTAVLLANVAALLLWLRHARGVAHTTGLSFGLEDKFFAPALVTSFEFWRTIASRLAFDIFGPLGLALLVWGLVRCLRSERRFEAAAAGGFVAYLLIVARGNFVHDYYQLVAVPVGSVLVAVGADAVASRYGRGSSDRRVCMASLLVGVIVLSAFLRSLNSWYGVPWEKAHVCAGRDQLAPDERLVLAGYQNPDLLFCLDRKGWILPPAAVSPAALGNLRAGGAGAVLVTNPAPSAVADWLEHNGQPLVENRKFKLYRLTRGVGAASKQPVNSPERQP